MSALGNKQTFRNAEAMSALPPIGHRLRFPDVCFGPIADIGTNFSVSLFIRRHWARADAWQVPTILLALI